MKAVNADLLTPTDQTEEMTAEEIEEKAENAAPLTAIAHAAKMAKKDRSVTTEEKAAKEESVARMVMIGERAAKDVLLTLTGQDVRTGSAALLTTIENLSEKTEKAD